MSMLDDLKRAQQSSISAYHQFLLKNTKSTECVHVFFEGHDDLSFYIGFIRKFHPHPKCLYTYKCHNKAGVYDTYSKVIKVASPKNTVLFFVDKDFSDILNENNPVASNIYVTDYYSIENFVVAEDILERILSEIYNFPNVSLETFEIREKFLKELDHFYAILRPTIAWIIWAKRNGLKPNLGNLDISKMYNFDNELTLKKTSMYELLEETNYLEHCCQVATPLEWSANCALILNELSTLPPKKYIRGKYELWFLVKFLDKLTELLQNTFPSNKERIRIRTRISESNAIALLGPRIQIPYSLEKFLKEYLGDK